MLPKYVDTRKSDPQLGKWIEIFIRRWDLYLVGTSKFKIKIQGDDLNNVIDFS